MFKKNSQSLSGEYKSTCSVVRLHCMRRSSNLTSADPAYNTHTDFFLFSVENSCGVDWQLFPEHISLSPVSPSATICVVFRLEPWRKHCRYLTKLTEDRLTQWLWEEKIITCLFPTWQWPASSCLTGSKLSTSNTRPIFQLGIYQSPKYLLHPFFNLSLNKLDAKAVITGKARGLLTRQRSIGSQTMSLVEEMFLWFMGFYSAFYTLGPIIEIR